MTAAEFRKLALSCQGASESAHMNHPDFRVGGRIFASLAPDGAWAMVKLAALDQATFVARSDGAMDPFPGAWGKQGCTKIHLDRADPTVVRDAVVAAHAHVGSGPARSKTQGTPKKPDKKKP